MDKPNFSLENWQRQRLNEYIFLRSGEQSAFDQISKDAKTDAELVIAALGLGFVLNDVPAIITRFEHELAIPRPWLEACIGYMAACVKDGLKSGNLKAGQSNSESF
jgi:hypothetical protein